MSYHLTLSHVGVFVTDMPKMLDFYTGFLGFAVSDRGQSRGGGEIVFMTRDPREHHQFVMANGRPEDMNFNIVNQLSFRVDSLDTLRELQRGTRRRAHDELGPVSHGNALSVYFHDPRRTASSSSSTRRGTCRSPAASRSISRCPTTSCGPRSSGTPARCRDSRRASRGRPRSRRRSRRRPVAAVARKRLLRRSAASP